MEKRIRNISTALLSVYFFIAFTLIYVSGRLLFTSSTSGTDYAGPSENLFNLKIPKDLQFAGEPIPTDDYSIKENMERVFAGGNFERSTAYILFSRAAQWFPLIEKILERNKIPSDFKYIALAESRLTNGISPQGAVGFWQFIASTAQYYGLEVNTEVDERYNVEKSTEAACKYFKEAYRKFGNWTLCAASYNMGMGGVEGHLKKQPNKSYYDLLMNKETSAYIYRILALKTVFMNSGKKFHAGGRNIYNIPSVQFKVDSAITDLSAFAASKDYSSDVLKTFNPWLITNKLSNPGHKMYIIRFPKKEYLQKIAAESNVKIQEPDSISLRKENKTDSLLGKGDTLLKITKDTLKK